jgi:hypothetical protein
MKFDYLHKKIIISLFAGVLILGGLFYSRPIKAQTVTTLTGQYGCLFTKNFAGFTVSNETGTGITGVNFLVYLDFTNSTFDFNLLGVHNYGDSGGASTNTASIAARGGQLSVTTGPITNSFLMSATISGSTITAILMPVNGGSTLLLQSGGGASGLNEPTAGVCNKV